MKYKAIFTSLMFLLPRNLDHQKPEPTEMQKFSTTISPASKREFLLNSMETITFPGMKFSFWNVIFFYFRPKKGDAKWKSAQTYGHKAQYVEGILYMAVTTAATKTATWSTNERTHASNVGLLHRVVKLQLAWQCRRAVND